MKLLKELALHKTKTTNSSKLMQYLWFLTLFLRIDIQNFVFQIVKEVRTTWNFQQTKDDGNVNHGNGNSLHKLKDEQRKGISNDVLFCIICIWFMIVKELS